MPRPIPLLLLFALGACASTEPAAALDPPAATAPKQNTIPAQITEVSTAERRAAPNDLGQVAMLLQGENAFVAQLQLSPLAEIPPHRDETEEYIVIIEGGGTLLVDGRSFQLRPGSAVLMPANSEVSYANGPETLVAIQVFAGPAPAKKYETWTPINTDEATNK